MSLKAGTVVELIARDGADITIKYRNLTGKIPATKLEEPKATAAAAAPKQDAEKPSEKKPAESKPSEAKPANPPQTNYGKAVQKAKDNAAAHDKNLAKPTDEVLKDQ
jgi:ribosome-binding protein aMBF1 (putative translation factor)